MKIIALVPVKNEAWIFPTYLSSLLKIADQIIALDDGSTDESATILKAAAHTIIPFSDKEEVNMSLRRKKLLEEGRRAGGSHFIWLDADEAFSFPFNEKGREEILKLRPGQKLSLRWVTLWKSPDSYRADTPWNDIYKDFIVCDDPSQGFENRFLSEARTPGDNNEVIKLPEEKGVVLHFQFVAFERAMLKQAYYRMRELIEGERNAKRINNTYSITLEKPGIRTISTPSDWFNNLTLPEKEADSSFYLKKIHEWFNQYGLKYFEPLELWQIEALRKEFKEKVGREPKSASFPRWLIKLNTWRQKFV